MESIFMSISKQTERYGPHRLPAVATGDNIVVMTKHNQLGAVNKLALWLILTICLLLAVGGFAGWAYSERREYKQNVDQKVSEAVRHARQEESKRKDAEAAEAAKNPLKTYNGPAALGSLVLQFPKTWSGYVEDSGNSQLNGYFAPGTVPDADNQKSVFALRVSIVSQSYDQVLQSFAGQQQAGKLTVSAYALPKLPNVVGVQVTGTLTDQKNVTMIVMPLRTETLQIWTEGTQYQEDFNKYILPNFSFSP